MKKFVNCIVLVLVLLALPAEVCAAEVLIPVGQVVGLELGNQTVTVAAFDEAFHAKDSGLQLGDRFLTIDGKAIRSTEDVRTALAQSNGAVDLVVQRKGQEVRLQLFPEITNEGPKLGVYLRNGVTGIGTVTFYDPASGNFGTLGHGVNDQTGSLLRLVSGKAYPAEVLSVRKGKSGEPGQLMGTITGKTPIGTLTQNTNQGVFGKAAESFAGQAIPVGSTKTVHTGNATIRSTISDSQVQEYSVEILKIYPASKSSGRNMLIKVTDPALLSATGGIVQGMSGSPIIQDGQLIGAVTHVLVNDPTMGYGIFIENMLDAAA